MKFLMVLASLIMPLQYAAAWGRFEGGFHPAHDVRFHRDPVIVHNTYVRGGGGGCVGCGVGAAAVAGLVGGVIVGAAIASANQPVVVEQPQTVVVQAPPPPAYGTQVAALPPGCGAMNVNGVTYYRCNQYWYQPYMGGNGVYYTLIP